MQDELPDDAALPAEHIEQDDDPDEAKRPALHVEHEDEPELAYLVRSTMWRYNSKSVEKIDEARRS